MKSIEFIQKIQAYYGNYPDGQKIEIANYLRGKRESLITELYKQLIANFSSKWKTPPDIAIFNEYINEALKLEERNSGQLQIDEDKASLEDGKAFFNELWNMLGSKKMKPDFVCNGECGLRQSFQAGTCKNNNCKYLKRPSDYEDILF